MGLVGDADGRTGGGNVFEKRLCNGLPGSPIVGNPGTRDTQ